MPLRTRPKVVIEQEVVNQSSRGGITPQIIVLHSTESHNRPGPQDLAGVVSWFNTRGASASSHVITDADGLSARCVHDARKAWTQAAYNSVSLSVEQVGFASQSEWPSRQLNETARWIALWSRRWAIPIRRGIVLNGRVIRKGVVTHKQLGQLGGGHVDPGKGFPMRDVLRRAKRFKKENK